MQDLQELIFPHLLVLQANDIPILQFDGMAKLATTCRAFSEVALNLRWRHCSFLQLIRVWKARGVVVQTYGNPPGDGNLIFARAPSAEDWRRFEYYTRRIHQLWLDCFDTTSEFIKAFATAVQERNVLPMFNHDGSSPLPIFPKLTSLEVWVGRTEKDLFACATIASESPILDRFEAHTGIYEASSHIWITLFASLVKLAIPLKSLVVQPGTKDFVKMEHMDSYTHSLTQLIVQSKLQELVLPGIAVTLTGVLNTILHLPTLKTLEIGSHPRFPDHFKAPVIRNAFSSLESLTGGVMLIKSLLISLPFPSLAKLVIMRKIDWNYFHWFIVPDLVGAIGESCPALEVLHLSLTLHSRQERDSFASKCAGRRESTDKTPPRGT
ncbi:hypothetical protein M407DRAFT_29136 [Tulasnella calospora MUT 4182]|uniref:F-box domain-containing protein n=1 Tax=Tulasnella calospora MUT 4182 TaxID=1051891 RepID=A0A0C3QAP2_9AGAM|nr:hypothetical protein M407DRAFT_29136 [Tulasnella calospora MUT 4182]